MSGIESKCNPMQADVQAVAADQDSEVQKPGLLNNDDAEQAQALAEFESGTAAERRLVRKLDFILLPVLWIMYVLAYIDRGNVVCTSNPCARARS
jgi:hypothetical protein